MLYFLLGILTTITLVFGFVFFKIYKKMKEKKGVFNEFFEAFFYEKDFEK